MIALIIYVTGFCASLAFMINYESELRIREDNLHGVAVFSCFIWPIVIIVVSFMKLFKSFK